MKLLKLENIIIVLIFIKLTILLINLLTNAYLVLNTNTEKTNYIYNTWTLSTIDDINLINSSNSTCPIGFAHRINNELGSRNDIIFKNSKFCIKYTNFTYLDYLSNDNKTKECIGKINNDDKINKFLIPENSKCPINFMGAINYDIDESFNNIKLSNASRISLLMFKEDFNKTKTQSKLIIASIQNSNDYNEIMKYKSLLKNQVDNYEDLKIISSIKVSKNKDCYYPYDLLCRPFDLNNINGNNESTNLLNENQIILDRSNDDLLLINSYNIGLKSGCRFNEHELNSIYFKVANTSPPIFEFILSLMLMIILILNIYVIFNIRKRKFISEYKCDKRVIVGVCFFYCILVYSIYYYIWIAKIHYTLILTDSLENNCVNDYSFNIISDIQPRLIYYLYYILHTLGLPYILFSMLFVLIDDFDIKLKISEEGDVDQLELNNISYN